MCYFHVGTVCMRLAMYRLVGSVVQECELCCLLKLRDSQKSSCSVFVDLHALSLAWCCGTLQGVLRFHKSCAPRQQLALAGGLRHVIC
jgi:hypothetical protein